MDVAASFVTYTPAKEGMRMPLIIPAARRRRFPKGARRAGHLTLELMLIFPIVLVLLLAMVEFSLILHARQQLLSASREACRVAAMGGSLLDVQEQAKQCLGEGRLGDAEVALTDANGQPLVSGQGVPSGTTVMVWVRLPTWHVVPDLLRFIGYSIKEDEIVGRTAMRRE